MASVEDLRKARTVEKTRVTKRVNELRRLVIEDAYSDVVAKFDSIKVVFHDFMQAHDAYSARLQDEADIVASDKYFSDVECSYINGLQGVRDYIKSGSKDSTPPNPPHTPPTPPSQLPGGVSYVKLPPVPQPDVFSGKPETYPMWKASFNTLVGKHNIGYDEKMFYLKQYTSGEAQSAIEALFLCPDKSSYDAAHKILEDRFGTTTLVASAFRRKLESWPRVGDHDSKALQRFSDFLAQICVAKKSYKALDILSDEFENKKILNKLPAWLVNKWIEKVVESVVMPDFDEFVGFIKEKATVANHALWAGHSSVKKTNLPKVDSRVQGQAHVIQSGTPTRQVQESQSSHKGCPVCSEGHKVSKCTAFSAMSLEDRRQVIRNKKMCFACLAVGHHSKECRNRHVCAVCSKKHPTLLHDYSLQHTSNVTATSENVNLATDLISSFKTSNRSTTMVLPVMLRHSSSGKEILVYAALDTQSNTNFVTNEVVQMLNVTGRRTTLGLTTMNGRKNVGTLAIDGFEVKSVTDGPYIHISSCYMRDSIPCRRDSIVTAEVLSKWSHLSHIDLPPYYDNAHIGILIGYHCPQVMRPLEIATGGEYEPFGWKTSVGWCVVGATCDEVDVNEMDDLGATHVVQGCIAFKTECREIMLDLDEDSMIRHGMDDKYSVEDVKFMEIMSDKMYQREDGHYEVPLPLKNETPFPSNRALAHGRLMGLKAKFKRDPSYHKRYSEVMSEMLDRGFSEIVPTDESSPDGRTWFIPHHSVIQPGKLRVVFDCSSEFKGVSLNERLLQGPNLLNLLLGILFRFRLKPIAITCDISKMYYQFFVNPGDRDLLRYLWWENGDYHLEPVDHRMCVHLFGAASSPGVATYALRKIALDHGSKYSEEASTFVCRDFYVDDGVTSVSSVSAARTLIAETQSLLDEGGCKCHKVMSNSKEVLDCVRTEDQASFKEDKFHKTLGLQWNVETDTFHFPLNFSNGKDEMTRRGLLSILAKIYDPLGVISPLVHEAKLLLHEMCKDKLQWDDFLSGELLKRFKMWCSKCNEIREVVIPRCICLNKAMFSPEMHHFADTSSTGYGACSYLRFHDENGVVHVAFMVGKCRVIPLKPVLSIPRLELVAAVLSVEIATKLRREVPLPCKEFFYTDSTVVLGYIQNVHTRFKVFVANRVQKIHDGSRPNQWFHVDSTDNPADDGSRAVLSERWLQGPEFLRNPDLKFEQTRVDISPDDNEVKCFSSQGDESQEVMPVRTFRTWYSTVKVWAWVLRFVNNCRGLKGEGSLRVEELERAKCKIVKLVQGSCFAREFKDLSQQKVVSRSSQLAKLDVFLDEDKLIRVGGRIRGSGLSDEVKHPLILPSDHELSWLIIQHFHELTHHQGRGMTCSEVRSNGFWILSLQKVVKKLIRTCVTCFRLRGKPVEQKMADLPEDRLTPYSPFWFSGCDLFGPFSVKSGRRQCKRYGVMFTCLVSRAVHIEVVHSLSTDSFINAFKRFVALRGSVRRIRCDQGTNFVGAKSELLKMGCDVIFNPPTGSHRGGAWERMIGVARRVIEGTLDEHSPRLDDEGLMTVLSEATSVINSRPLNIDSITDPQSLEPLTPNHLITMKSKIIPRTISTDSADQPDLYATKQWRRVQFMIDLFWSRWRKEIVQQHQSRAKWNTPRKNLVIGDVVLLVDDQCHRSYWKLGRIVDVYPSQDGLVRTVNVQLADRSVLKRPVQKLVKLLSK